MIAEKRKFSIFFLKNNIDRQVKVTHSAVTEAPSRACRVQGRFLGTKAAPGDCSVGARPCQPPQDPCLLMPPRQKRLCSHNRYIDMLISIMQTQPDCKASARHCSQRFLQTTQGPTSLMHQECVRNA
jgi:hypothetical protein